MKKDLPFYITTIIEGAITVPYMVYTESGTAKVKKFDLSTATITYKRIDVDKNGKLYVQQHPA